MRTASRPVATLGALAMLLVAGCDPDAVRESLFGATPPASIDPDARIDDMARALGLQAADDGAYSYARGEFVATIAANGTVTFSDDQEPGISGPADWRIRGELRGAAGKDALELLQATADLRRAMSIRWYTDLVARSLETLDAELMAILDAHHLSMRQRRALVFARWDQADEMFETYAASTAESAVGDIHRLQAEATEQARARIEAFVRRHLPVGTSEGYRNDELEQLNAGRKSEALFDPYDGQAVMG